MPTSIKKTLEFSDCGKNKCEHCKETRDCVFIECLHDPDADTSMFIICQDCLTNAISDAIDEGTSTTFETT